ncbi:putative vitamin H transporter [Aaosphaeria arxii CBS 175.79]|uniref:Putative vitamin H transporter n=1 Tax=Aaosphaeria arxii CBS 175.79 TaxID=1450172 RepID=A0A6A5XBG6_9PLEO|nr:putative vitamin H transporter [Aaosphaeria arxii CBS 175.79]KAF2010271.1 putative vitamin H transporter [Aaosphaeria arxii CBS 175.79]
MLLQQFPLLVNASKEELHTLERSVLKKLDYKFLIIVTLMLLMSYLDRINISNARLAGLQEDLGMTDIPANIILAKTKPRIFLPTIMLAWSAVTISMPAMKSPWSFMLCRFLVGITEGPFFPGVCLVTTSWYTKSESPSRMAIWHAGNIISNRFSGLLAAGILTNMDGIAKLRSWQWFFLFEGIASILIAGLGYWGLPNYPSNSPHYFSPEETEMAQYRMTVSSGGQSEDDEGGAMTGFWQAVKDPFTWIFAAMHFTIILSQSFKDFFPSIVKTLGYSKIVTYLIQAPPYFVTYGLTLLVSWSSGRHVEHCWHIIGAMCVSITGCVIMISTLNTGARYFSLFMLVTGPFIALIIHVPWETSVVPGPRTKRAALIAIANSISSTSHWFSPYFFLRSQEPRYQTGGGVIIAGGGATIIMCLIARWWVLRKNKQLEKIQEETGVVSSWRYCT